MKKTMLSLALALGLAAWPGSADAQTITLNLNQKGVAVSPMLYGLMTEEINYAYEGGLIAQLVHDPTFRENGGGGRGRRMPQGLRFWHPTDSVTVRIAPDNRNPMNAATPTSLRVETQGVGGAVNDGFWGYPVRPSTTYKGRLWLRSDGPTVTVRLESADGIIASELVEVNAVSSRMRENTVENDRYTVVSSHLAKLLELVVSTEERVGFHVICGIIAVVFVRLENRV